MAPVTPTLASMRLSVEAVPYEIWQRPDMDREQYERMKLEGDRRQQARLLAGLV